MKNYYTEKKIEKIVKLFKKAGEREEKRIPAMLLTGVSGCGKTYLAECFAQEIGAKCLFLQCFAGMTADNMIAEPNISAIIKKDSQNVVKKGILVKALEATTDGDTVVVIDELDKANPEVDSFLLDFLNSGRVTNGQEEWRKSDGHIWVFITSNENRDLNEALKNRCRNVYLERPLKENFLKAVGDTENLYHISLLYDKFESMSIRQAKEYIEDLKILETDFDMEALEQYINTDIEVSTLEDIETFGSEGQEIKYNYISVDRYIDINEWIRFIDTNKLQNNLVSDDDGDLYIEIRTLEQYINVMKYDMGTEEIDIHINDIEIPKELITKQILAQKISDNSERNYGILFIKNTPVEGYFYKNKAYCSLRIEDMCTLFDLDRSKCNFENY